VGNIELGLVTALLAAIVIAGAPVCDVLAGPHAEREMQEATTIEKKRIVGDLSSSGR
jgi:hypothetical protein